MGYAATTNVIFGVRLSNAEAKKFHDHVMAIAGASPDDDDALASALFAIGVKGNVVMRADGADSRIDNTEEYSERDNFDSYATGFDLGGKGYGCNADVAKMTAKAGDPVLIAKFSKHIAPLLAAAGIKAKEPTTIVTTQTH